MITASLVDLAFGVTARGADIAVSPAIGVFLLVMAVPAVRGRTVAQACPGRVLLHRGEL